jgi:hypothetical protein
MMCTHSVVLLCMYSRDDLSFLVCHSRIASDELLTSIPWGSLEQLLYYRIEAVTCKDARSLAIVVLHHLGFRSPKRTVVHG